jgi:hypothetical protein
MFGPPKEFKEQLKRIRVIAYTDRGKLIVTDGKPRVYLNSWAKVVLGFDDEPWDLSAGTKTAVKLDMERVGGRMRGSDGIEIMIPNWWIVAVSLSGWYRQDVLIDGKLVLSKPQVSVWERLNEAQPAYVLFKLGEHPPLILPWPLRVRWNLKWGIEAELAHVPPLSNTLRKWGLVDRFLGLRRWVDR